MKSNVFISYFQNKIKKKLQIKLRKVNHENVNFETLVSVWWKLDIDKTLIKDLSTQLYILFSIQAIDQSIKL